MTCVIEKVFERHECFLWKWIPFFWRKNNILQNVAASVVLLWYYQLGAKSEHNHQLGGTNSCGYTLWSELRLGNWVGVGWGGDGGWLLYRLMKHEVLAWYTLMLCICINEPGRVIMVYADAVNVHSYSMTQSVCWSCICNYGGITTNTACFYCVWTLQWRHNERYGVSNHQPQDQPQPFIQAQSKENINAPRHRPLCGEFTSDRWIPHTKGR